MAGRIRTIKPEWLEDELIASEPDHVRLLSVGLILMADDHGRGRAAPAFVAGEVYRYDRSPEVLTKVREGLSRLSERRFVTLYEVDGQSYFEIRSWAKHQKVQHAGAPRVPSPSHENAVITAHSRVTPAFHEGLTRIHESLQNPPEVLTPDLRSPISDLRSPTSLFVGNDAPSPERPDGSPAEPARPADGDLESVGSANAATGTAQGDALDTSDEHVGGQPSDRPVKRKPAPKPDAAIDCLSPSARAAVEAIQADSDLAPICKRPNALAADLAANGPGVDIVAQVRAAGAWLRANPNRKKRNGNQFLLGWVRRSQERGSSPQRQPQRPPWLPPVQPPKVPADVAKRPPPEEPIVFDDGDDIPW